MVLLNIGINARCLDARLGGVQRYTANLIEGLAAEALRRNYRITLFTSKAARLSLHIRPDFHIQTIYCEFGRTAMTRHLWEQLILPVAAKREHVDVLINPANTAPVFHPSNIVVLHDICWRNSAWTGHAFNTAYSVLIPNICKRALHIITPSCSSQTDIVTDLDIPADKVTVIPEGIPMLERRELNSAEQLLVSTIPSSKFILHVGGHRRKNVAGLIEAWQLVSQQQSDNVSLVLVGDSDIVSGRDESLLHPQKGIVHLGYVSDALLSWLYEHAMGLVSASFKEGFGLPLVEAMSYSLPLCLSDIPSYREVAGEAAIYFDPLNANSITDSLKLLIRNEPLRDSLRNLSYTRSHLYSWSSHAERFMNIVDDLVRVNRVKSLI